VVWNKDTLFRKVLVFIASEDILFERTLGGVSARFSNYIGNETPRA
jgi:hypothetical protein